MTSTFQGLGVFLCSTNRSLAVKINQCRFAFPMQKVEFCFCSPRFVQRAHSVPFALASLFVVWFYLFVDPKGSNGCCFVILLFCTVFTVL